MLLGEALSLAQPCYFHPFQNREKHYVRLAFWSQLPIRGIITTDKGRYFSLICNTCNAKKLKKFRFLLQNYSFAVSQEGI